MDEDERRRLLLRSSLDWKQEEQHNRERNLVLHRPWRVPIVNRPKSLEPWIVRRLRVDTIELEDPRADSCNRQTTSTARLPESRAKILWHEWIAWPSRKTCSDKPRPHGSGHWEQRRMMRSTFQEAVGTACSRTSNSIARATNHRERFATCWQPPMALETLGDCQGPQ